MKVVGQVASTDVNMRDVKILVAVTGRDQRAVLVTWSMVLLGNLRLGTLLSWTST